MTKVSSVIKKYMQTNGITVLYNTKYINTIVNACYSKYTHVTINTMNIFGCYDIYVVDSDKVGTIAKIYKRYLCRIIIVDDNQDFIKKTQLYLDYKKLYNIKVFCPTIESYLSGYNTYDGYLDTKKMDHIFIP